MRHAYRIVPMTFALGVALSLPAFAAANTTQGAKAQTGSAQTRISEADARKTALASVANGSVQQAKLVTDKGRQVWSFDLKSTTSANGFNVQVDADTGRIVSKSIVTAAQAQKAAKREK